MEDAALVRSIMAALERDTDVNLHRSEMEVIGAGVLRLTGEAEDIAVKRRALQIARRLAGERSVVDELVVRVQAPRTGDQLRQAVLDRLMQEPDFAGFAIRAHGEGAPPALEQDRIEVRVDGGRVRLDGRVWSLSHRRLAEVLAWWTPGTADVDNRIRVEPAEQDSDDEISDAVRLVFERDRSFDAQQIRIETRDAEVRLQGTVPSAVSRKLAGLDCWYIPGVHAVRNELQVQPRVR